MPSKPSEEYRRHLVSLLLERGASVHVQDFCLGNAIQPCLTMTEFQLLLKLLLNHGADINAVHKERQITALQAVIEFYDDYSLEDYLFFLTDQVRCLIENGANVNIGAGAYGFPLQSACSKKDDNFAMCLLQACPDLDIHAVGGLFGRALQAAAYSGHVDVVKILLHRGVNPNVKGGKYRSALNAAIFQGRWHIVEMLLENGTISDRQQFQEPDEEWLSLIEKESTLGTYDDMPAEEVELVNKDQVDGEAAVERYRIFWERQPMSADAV
ncbi:hypothetical protein RRF57_008880 [Xylaria bambusicola]|uniref:Ankyrin n=1 Tax=Xylaria bambusicola TaxID=326684 RepID=A0AAN7UUP0_9PEZI